MHALQGQYSGVHGRVAHSPVVGIVNRFILKALIFWEKVMASLVFEN